MQLGSQNWSIYKSLVITVDKAADQLKGYVAGAQVGSTVTGLGNWAGALAATSTLIGAVSTAPSGLIKGTIAHVILLNRAATLAEIQKYNSPA